MNAYQTPSGVFIEPTSSDRQKDEAKAANKKNSERVAKMEAKQREENLARTAALPTQSERFQTITLGATRTAAKMRRQGDAAKADKLQAVADEMATALETFRKAKSVEAKPVQTPLADAITAAAAELKKALPKSFPALTDAEDFAGRYLALTSARAEQTRANDLHYKAGQAVCIAANAFWDLTEKAARAASGSVNDTAIKELEAAGSL